MEEPISTPKLPPPVFKQPAAPTVTKEQQQFSSSPGFGTPAYTPKPRIPQPPPPLRQAFAAAQKANASTTDANTTTPTVLPILLPPTTLRPIAFRTLTKKHNLTLTSPALSILSTFVGKFCGSGWRDEGLAEKVLDEIARQWKQAGNGIIVEDGPDTKLTAILKILEPCMLAGRLDHGKLSRTNSSVGSLSRQNSLDVRRPELGRDDSTASLGLSGLDMSDNDDDETLSSKYRDARPFLKVISGFQQPRLNYSTTKKTIETLSTEPSLLPTHQAKIAMFRNRYHLIHQRLLRNESFQTPSFAGSRPPHLSRAGSSLTQQQSYKLTPISALLGRSGSYHLLLGLLATTATSDLALTDLSGSVVLDLTHARPVPKDGAFFCPGMIVLLEGTYEEDGSNNSNLGSSGGVGGQIKGRFLADMMSGPPTERRDVTVGIGQSQTSDHVQTSVGAGFGWVDFLGVGSEKAVGAQMRRLQSRLLSNPISDPSADENSASSNNMKKRTKIAIIAECHLDSPRTLDALRCILNSYTTSSSSTHDSRSSFSSFPLAIVLMGNFLSSAAMSSSSKAGSIEYKEHFDALAAMLSEYPRLLASTTFIFVPGDNDPWASTFSAGAATCLPRQGLPELLTSRVRRAFASANADLGSKDGEKGEAIFTSNPARVSLFGPMEELVLFRDDVSGRMRRNAVNFPNLDEKDNKSGTQPPPPPPPPPRRDSEEAADEMDLDAPIRDAASHIPTAANTTNLDQATAIGRRLTKTLLDQSHLSPFPVSLRPVAWDYASALQLYPLPTALVIADAEAPAFCVTYEGCVVMNPGRLLERGAAERRARGGALVRWVEFEVGNGGRGKSGRSRGCVREARF